MPVQQQRKRVVKHKTATPLFQAPASSEVERPTEHNGIPVEREELLGNLPSGAHFKISKLHLANGTVAYACRECLFTGDTMTDARNHRNQEHGARFGNRPPVITNEPEALTKQPETSEPETTDADEPTDVLGPPVIEPKLLSEPLTTPAKKHPTMPKLSKHILEKTLGEFIALCPSIDAMGDTIDRLQAEIDDLKAELDASQLSKEDQHKIHVYEQNREEVLSLRLEMHKHKNCEEIRTERDALRAWKKKMRTKLKALGAQLGEE